MANRRILIHHDSEQFGGHELAFLSFLPGLMALKDVKELCISCYTGNRKLIDALKSLNNSKIRLRVSSFRKRRGEPYFAFFRILYLMYMNKVCREERPDLVILLQGRIENCLVALIVCKMRGHRVISYVPMAHSLSTIGSRFRLLGLGDHVRRFYYKMADGFVVPSTSVARQLRSAGVRKRIEVTPNFVPAAAPISQEIARKMLGIGRETSVACFIGRYDIKQKGLDQLAACIGTLGRNQKKWTFIFVGGGDEHHLKSIMSNVMNEKQIKFLPWTNNTVPVYCSSDVVLLPSRFEGFPLVLLEAASLGIPILASPIEVFAEFLPSDMLFDFEAKKNFVDALTAASSSENQAFFRSQLAPALVEKLEADRRADRFSVAISSFLRSD